MNVTDEESYPEESVRGNGQSSVFARTNIKPKEDNVRALKAVIEASEDIAAVHIADGKANKRQRVLNDSLQGSFHDQECNYAKNCPYVPMNVEEVSVVKSLKLWTNPNVRIIGKFVLINSHFTLCGIGQDQGEIYLNVENLDQYPKHGDIVEVFGTLCADEQCIYQSTDHSFQEPASQVKLKVMFHRSVLNVPIYKKGLSLVKPYIPLFLRRD